MDTNYHGEQLTPEEKKENDKMKNNLKKALEEFMEDKKAASKKQGRQILKGNFRRDRQL